MDMLLHRRMLVLAVVTALALVIAFALPKASSAEPPGPVDVTFEAPDVCDFPVSVKITGESKTIVLPDDSQLITSPGLRATLTNLKEPDNQVSFGITGPIHQRELDNGVLLDVGSGHNLLLDPGGGAFLTTGRTEYTLTPTDVPGVFDITILESTGQVIDVCALLE
jgi:hypothetical protein